jgi:molybdopterin/thiamine biosynthesis adenylyltransferase/nitroreductase
MSQATFVSLPSTSTPEDDPSADYRPLVLRRSEARDRDMLELFFRDPPRVEVHDTFVKQLEGLIKSRRPKRPPSRHELDAEVRRYAGDRVLADVGVWVYYPWRRAVVHLLDEVDFVELRTSRNRYKITDDEQSFLRRQKVGIVGLSVGSEVALTMAAERSCGELRLADFDVLELSNLNRLRQSVLDLGLNKATLAARRVAELDPFLKVVCYPAGLTSQNLDAFLLGDGRLDVLVDECDGLATKLECRRRARELGIPVVMEANDRATLDIERFDREPGRPLLHGLLEDLDLSLVADLRAHDEKVPYLMPMVGESTMSDKLRASFLEVGESIETWPQLASDVALGAGIVTNVVRRMALGQLTESGRHFVDLEELVRDERTPGCESTPMPARAEALRPASALLDAEPLPPPLPGQIAPPDEVLAALLDAAVRAPSGANEQPWRWVRANADLWLLPNRRFGDSLLNYRDSATYSALGAAAENLVLRAHELGLRVQVEAPSATQRVPMCRFKFFPQGSALDTLEPPTWDALAPFLTARHTNRRRVGGAPIPGEQLEELAALAATVPGLELRFVSNRAAVSEVAQVAARADRIRMLNPAGHRDLVREICWTKEEAERRRDGIDLRTLDLTTAEDAGLRMLRFPGVPELLRKWKAGQGLEKLTHSALVASSAVGLLTVARDSIRERFLAGRALERVWLAATRLGLSLQPHTAPIFLFARALGAGSSEFDAETIGELLALQARLRGVFEARGAEVFLFRLFASSKPLARSLRLPVSAERLGSES